MHKIPLLAFFKHDKFAPFCFAGHEMNTVAKA